MNTGLIEWEEGLGNFSRTFQLWSPMNSHKFTHRRSRYIHLICFVVAIHSYKYFLIHSSLLSDNLIIIAAIISSILQMGKLKLRELDHLAQDRIARKWRDMDLHPGPPGSHLRTPAYLL